MEPEISLPCSQGLPTGPHTELNESSAYYLLYFMKCVLILSSFHILPNGGFPSGFSIQRLCDFLISHIRAACTARLILPDLNALLASRYLLRSRLGPRYPIRNLWFFLSMRKANCYAHTEPQMKL
jgi:hypothetical protein